MIYCMSDIHGELDRFKAMLDLINFSSDDTLYIIGDVIDRHPGGVEILKIIKDTPNMFMLLGNHEQMCLDTLGPNSVYGSRRLWLENGGSNTYRELLYVCSLAERSRIIHFLSTLPDILMLRLATANSIWFMPCRQMTRMIEFGGGLNRMILRTSRIVSQSSAIRPPAT